jgi:uncharacterized protein (TIGR00159 family)
MKLFDILFIEVHLADLLDITIVAFLMYKLQKVLRKGPLFQVLLLVLAVFFLWRVVELLNLELVGTLMREFFQVGLLGLVVIFAPQIRRSLIEMGQNPFFKRLRKQLSSVDLQTLAIEEIVAAAEELAAYRTGALIVLARDSDLDNVLNSGDALDAAVSRRLLISIFNPKSPLHDGAVVIKGKSILAARCVLPVSDDPDIPPELGLRHRSALGITEVTDAAAIIVSEETGKVSVALGGRLKRNLSAEELVQFLRKLDDGNL